MKAGSSTRCQNVRPLCRFSGHIVSAGTSPALSGSAHLTNRGVFSQPCPIQDLQIKAWCYYESRLLGAHHGLLSSYALETLVLNVINLHHSVVHTPLQVCSLLWGPSCRLVSQAPGPLYLDRWASVIVF